MDKSKNYENAIPQDYVLVKHVDAKNDKSQMAVYTALSFVPPLILLPIFILIARYCNGYKMSDLIQDHLNLIPIFITCIVLILYIVLHELVHGLTYKVFTGAKLKFGLTLTVAFCGVPEIYVRKKASFAALVMPFFVFSILFIALTIGLWFLSPFYGVLSGAVLAIHIGGCVGDLHWALMYLTKFKHCNTLMRDTGPEQWLYIPKSEAEKYGIACILDDNSK